MADTEPEASRGERPTYKFFAQARSSGDMVAGEVIVYTLASAPAWTAIAAVLKTYLTRNADRSVSFYGKGGEKVIVKGNFTPDEIESLLRAHAGRRMAEDITEQTMQLASEHKLADEETMDKLDRFLHTVRRRKKAPDPIHEDRAEG